MMSNISCLLFYCELSFCLLIGVFGCDRRSIEGLNLDVNNVEIREECFEGLGCFNNSLYCHRFGFPPNHPDAINTRFYLYTRSNPDYGDQLHLNDRTSFSRFNPTKDTKIIIHGYMDSHDVTKMVGLRDAILQADDVNLIMINWSGGGSGHYHDARLNIRVVGRQGATLINFIRKEFNPNMKIHIIGHSLGAHAAGYVGEESGRIERITGLDPASPWFTNEINNCKLDATDAAFVDIIHTDAHDYGLGIVDQIGHQDFYPNGGESMPGCGMFSFLCSHLRSIEYFIASIRRCSFIAYKCNTWEDFTSGLCETDCRYGVCAKMGYNATENQPMGKYYLRTSKYEPYCI